MEIDNGAFFSSLRKLRMFQIQYLTAFKLHGLSVDRRLAKTFNRSVDRSMISQNRLRYENGVSLKDCIFSNTEFTEMALRGHLEDTLAATSLCCEP